MNQHPAPAPSSTPPASGLTDAASPVPPGAAGVPWYYGVGQQRVGPVESSSLMALIAAAQIRPETLVWRSGMPGWLAAKQVPELTAALDAAAPLRATTPPVQPGYVGVGTQSDATGGLIPYNNGAALAGYYVSIVALVPVLGLLLSPVAIWLGIKGLRAVKREPLIRGSVHAWIGIGLGSVVLLMHLLVLTLIVIAVAT